MRVKEEAEGGGGGGGMATALGILCLGVGNGVRLFVGVVDGRPTPTPETRPPVPGFGVFRDDPRIEVIEPVEGEIGPLNRVGLPVTGVRLPDCPVGLVGSRSRLLLRLVSNRMCYKVEENIQEIYHSEMLR